MLISRRARGMGDMGFSVPGWDTVKKIAAVAAPAITLPVLLGAKIVTTVAPSVLSAAPKALALVAPAITIPGIVGLKSGGTTFTRFDPNMLAASVRVLQAPQVAPSSSLPVTLTSSSPSPGGGGGGGYTLPDGTVVGAAPTTLIGKFNALSGPMKLGLVALVGGGIYFGVKRFGGGASTGHAPKSAQSHHP